MHQRWFTERADDAHRLFMDAALRARAGTRVYEHLLPGPNGEALATAVARIGADRPDRAVVIVSGTHGIEGHAGSPVQSALLDRLTGSSVPDGLALILVHLINPWGCAWNRRENEDNVDMFRNLLYARPPFAENALYDQYELGINPRAWTGPDRAKSDAVWNAFVEEHGLGTVIGTVRRGQHAHPLGMTYHGTTKAWSYRVAEDIGREHLSGVPRVDVLDIHTGYGAFGEATFVSTQGPGERTDRVHRWFAGRILELGLDPLIPKHPSGPYNMWEAFTGEGRVNMVGIEYGTRDVGAEFELFRANTFIHTRGDLASEFGRRTSADYRELFYPASPAWRGRILEQGLDAISTVLAD